MAFSTLSPQLQLVAQQALNHCKTQFGSKGLKVEVGIDASIAWRPTFVINPKRFELFAFEVNDIIFPSVIKEASHDIHHYSGLIRVISVCPLEIYQNDRDLKKSNLLRSQGFGMMTVSADGDVVEQFPCVPLQQFIAMSELESLIKDFPKALKVRLRGSYKTYLTNTTNGVQDCGKILEGLVTSVAKQCAQRANLSEATLKKSAANLIDDMYTNQFFEAHRATLGGVRSFLRLYRNPTSHAPKTAREAAEQVKTAKEGFIQALRQIKLLAETAKKLTARVIIYE